MFYTLQKITSYRGLRNQPENMQLVVIRPTKEKPLHRQHRGLFKNHIPFNVLKSFPLILFHWSQL